MSKIRGQLWVNMRAYTRLICPKYARDMRNGLEKRAEYADFYTQNRYKIAFKYI